MEETKIPTSYTRYKFTDIFQESSDGALSPKKQIEVNGVVFGQGINFQKGVAFGGIDFHLFKYRDIAAIEKEGDVLEIVGFYKQP